jgi:hypothetical protein
MPIKKVARSATPPLLIPHYTLLIATERSYMVFIKDIWMYFLDEEWIENAYIDIETGSISDEEYDYTIRIPKIFKRLELLKSYIADCGDKKFQREMNEVPDKTLLSYLYQHYLPYTLPDYKHYQWIIYAKK